MSRAIRAVLFDMDGVVVDSMPLHRRVWTEFARTHGLHPTEAEVRAADGRRAVEVVRMLFGADLSEDRAMELAAEREEYYHQVLRTESFGPVEGVVAFLEALGRAGIPRVLATSATPDNVHMALGRLGLMPLFEAVLTAADVTRGKPDPEVYLKAAERAQTPPERCLVVEDAIAGVQAAKAAGASCLGLSTSQTPDALRAAGADWVAPNFRDLPAPLRVMTEA